MQFSQLAAAPDTLIFVDVDGVLNVGIKDENPKVPALDFSKDNLNACYSILRSGKASVDEADIVDKILSVEACSLGHLGEGYATYGEMLSNNPDSVGFDLIHVFVQRLAMMIRSAGPRRFVVLSSNWRKPAHAKKLQKLEMLIANALGEPFAFDAKTSLEEARDQSGRLQGIGAFIQHHIASSRNVAGPLRVLVLDDFHNRSLNGWKCDGNTINSTQDAEAYLQKYIPAHMSSTVKLVHTYTEWHTESGRLVQLGSGMTMNHFCDGMEFLMASMKQLVPPQDAKATAARKKHISHARLRAPPQLGRENIEEGGNTSSDNWSDSWSTDTYDAEQWSPSKVYTHNFSSPCSTKFDMEASSVHTTFDALASQRPIVYGTGYPSYHAPCDTYSASLSYPYPYPSY